jgi:hypothetical protein
MTLFFTIHSVALVEDLPELVHLEINDTKEFFETVDFAYDLIASNCWRAAWLYLGTLLFCIWQYYLNYLECFDF